MIAGGIPKEETMLYRYACIEMGLKCPYIAKSETLEEVTKLALEHVRENHADDFNRIQTQAEIEVMEKALARSTRVVAG
jgi:predicted small metal-binding protein